MGRADLSVQSASEQRWMQARSVLRCVHGCSTVKMTADSICEEHSCSLGSLGHHLAEVTPPNLSVAKLLSRQSAFTGGGQWIIRAP